MSKANVETDAPEPMHWVPIDLGEAGSFEVRLMRPTVAQVWRDAEMIAGYVQARVKTAVCDWRGLNDKADRPIPYSWEMLERLCIIYPNMAIQLAQHVGVIYAGLPENVVKNSDAPPSTHLPEAAPAAQPSNSTADSATSNA